MFNNHQYIYNMKYIGAHINKQKTLLYNKCSKNTYIYNYYPENIKMFVRISGVWESDTHIGVTSKLYIYPSTLKF
jgi:hypothetical protein